MALPVPPALFFPHAPGADVVRSVQRDGFALDDLRAQVARAAEVLIGPRLATRFEPSGRPTAARLREELLGAAVPESAFARLALGAAS